DPARRRRHRPPAAQPARAAGAAGRAGGGRRAGLGARPGAGRGPSDRADRALGARPDRGGRAGGAGPGRRLDRRHRRRRARGTGPRLLQPLLAWSWMVTLPLRRAERSARPSMVAANGQFLLVDAAALAAAGGPVLDAVLDDIALARAVKRSGGRVGVADGSAI